MSISVLEKYVAGVEKKTLMPVVSCIGLVGDNGCSVVHSWDDAVDVDPTEMSCQVLYLFKCIL